MLRKKFDFKLLLLLLTLNKKGYSIEINVGKSFSYKTMRKLWMSYFLQCSFLFSTLPVYSLTEKLYNSLYILWYKKCTEDGIKEISSKTIILKIISKFMIF